MLLLAGFLVLGGCAGPVAESPAPTPVPTAAETATATPEVELTAEKVTELWGFPIDDTHDAFEVPTGGKRGTVLVTVEATTETDDEEGTLYYFSVWAKDDLTTPIQQMEAYLYILSHWHGVVDANFDGYMDFTYQWLLGAKAGLSRLWVWDEKTGQFVEEPEYAEIQNPRVEQETKTISGYVSYSAAGDGEETFHRWENGKLVCFRKVERTYPDENGNQEKVTYEPVDGEMTEVSREPLVMLG